MFYFKFKYFLGHFRVLVRVIGPFYEVKLKHHKSKEKNRGEVIARKLPTRGRTKNFNDFFFCVLRFRVLCSLYKEGGIYTSGPLASRIPLCTLDRTGVVVQKARAALGAGVKTSDRSNGHPIKSRETTKSPGLKELIIVFQNNPSLDKGW